MLKKILIIIVITYLFGYTAFHIATKMFSIYSENHEMVKNSLIIEHLKEKFVNGIKNDDDKKIEQKLKNYLEKPSSISISGVFIIQKDKKITTISEYKNPETKEKFNRIVLRSVDFDNTKTRPIVIKLNNFSILAYAKGYDSKLGSFITGKRRKLTIAGVIKDSQYLQETTSMFGGWIAFIIVVSVLIISFTMYIIFNSLTNNDKNILSRMIDEIITYKNSKIPLTTPFKEEIIKVINLVSSNTEVTRKNIELEEKVDSLINQNNELMNRLENKSQEQSDVGFEKDRVEQEIYSLVSYLVNFVEIQKEKFWLIQQYTEKINNEDLSSLASTFTDFTAVERESKQLVGLVDELVALISKKDEMHSIVTQLQSRIQDILSLSEFYSIESKAKVIIEKFDFLESQTTNFQKEYNNLHNFLEKINREAFKNRLLMSQNYKAFMEKLSDIRKKIDGQEIVTIDDVDKIHSSYRIALNSFRQFIDNILTESNLKSPMHKDVLNLESFKNISKDLVEELEEYKENLKIKGDPLLKLSAENTKIIKYIVDLYYTYIDNMNRRHFYSYIETNKKSIDHVQSMQNWINKITNINNENLSSIEDLNRHLH